MSLRLIRPVLGRIAFAKMLEQFIQNESELCIVFLHKDSRDDHKEGSVYFDYNPITKLLGLVMRLYVIGTDEYGNARFLSWKGPVDSFLKALSQSKDVLGHNSVRGFMLSQTHLGKYGDLEPALRNVEFKSAQEVFTKDPVIYKRAKKKPKYKPENDPNQPRLF